jgi:hypothetical protein
VPDRVEATTGRVVITAAKSRDWDAMTTIRYDERLWRLEECRPLGDGTVQYVLEPVPEHHVVRQLVRYP